MCVCVSVCVCVKTKLPGVPELLVCIESFGMRGGDSADVYMYLAEAHALDPPAQSIRKPVLVGTQPL